MMKKPRNTIATEVKKVLYEHADLIQKLATEHHKSFISNKKFRSEFIDKYQKNHIKIVKEFANNLEINIQNGEAVFKRLGKILAHDAVNDELTLEEAVDGIIFLKQAVWEIIEKHPVFTKITVNDFYAMSQAVGSYCDIISSQIAITYHNHVEKNLIKAEKRFRTLIEKSTDVIALADDQYNYHYVTPSIIKVLGYTPEKFLILDKEELIYDDDRKRIIKMFNNFIETKGKSVTVEFRCKHKNGTWKWIEVTVTNLLREPTIHAVVFNFRDITDRKELERQKEEFLGIASHELKTPVTSLKGYTQVLERRFKKAGDTATAKYLSKMDAQLNKLSNLIGDLLDITKIDAGKLQFHFEEFNMNHLVTETIESLQLVSDKHKIILKGSYDKNICADRNRISQVISNILLNAIKYSPQADKVVVTLIDNKEYVTVDIEDFGVGISPKNLNKVFDRFYRESGAEEVTFSGLGLGLYICKEIIERHGGMIEVASTKGKGSHFTFILPVKKHINE